MYGLSKITFAFNLPFPQKSIPQKRDLGCRRRCSTYNQLRCLGSHGIGRFWADVVFGITLQWLGSRRLRFPVRKKMRNWAERIIKPKLSLLTELMKVALFGTQKTEAGKYLYIRQ